MPRPRRLTVLVLILLAVSAFAGWRLLEHDHRAATLRAATLAQSAAQRALLARGLPAGLRPDPDCVSAAVQLCGMSQETPDALRRTLLAYAGPGARTSLPGIPPTPAPLTGPTCRQRLPAAACQSVVLFARFHGEWLDVVALPNVERSAGGPLPPGAVAFPDRGPHGRFYVLGTQVSVGLIRLTTVIH